MATIVHLMKDLALEMSNRLFECPKLKKIQIGYCHKTWCQSVESKNITKNDSSYFFPCNTCFVGHLVEDEKASHPCAVFLESLCSYILYFQQF